MHLHLKSTVVIWITQKCSMLEQSMVHRCVPLSDPKIIVKIYRQSPIFLLLTKNFLFVITCEYGNFSLFLYDMVNPTLHFFNHQIWAIWQCASIVSTGYCCILSHLLYLQKLKLPCSYEYRPTSNISENW